MATAEPIFPAYGGPSVDALTPALLRQAGQRPSWLPEVARDAPQVVLLLLDGLGWGQLRARPALAPTLCALAGGPITSVVPSTTATALTSVALGVPPAGHGVMGYRVKVDGPSGTEIRNVLRWRTVSGDARPFVPPEEFQPSPAFGGRAVPVLTRAEFTETGFSRAHLGGARQIGWWHPSGLVVDARRQLEAGEPFVYAYYDGVDRTAHIYGFGEHYDAELRAADRLVADLLEALPPGAVLVVTADHGQVEVGDAVAPLDGKLGEALTLVSGEARFRWLHVVPGSLPDVLAGARERYGEEAWVWSVEELEGLGAFGGPLPDAARQRVGDVALVPFRPVAYLDPLDRIEVNLICRHGSLTADEMLVPCVAGTA